MSHYLIEIWEGAGRPRAIPLPSFPFWIGRDPGNHLILHDPLVSRRHAYLQRQGANILLADNHSRNGTYVNDTAVTGFRELSLADVIRIGPYRLRISAAAETEVGELSEGHQVDFVSAAAGWDPAAASMAGSRRHADAERLDPTLIWSELLPALVGSSAEQFYRCALETIDRLVRLDRCFFILFRDESLDALQVVAQKIGPSFLLRQGSQLHVSRAILARMAQMRRAVMVHRDDAAFQPTESFVRSGAASVLCLPLMALERVFGAVYIDRLKTGGRFGEEEVSSLAPVVSLISLKLENMRLVEEQMRLELEKRELDAARAVQQRFLPRRSVSVPGFQMCAVNQPCLHVGGDCVDLGLGLGGRLAFAVGDVAGKGLPAALYMVGVLSTLRAHFADGFSLGEVMTKLEQYVRNSFKPEHFLTLFLAEVDRATAVLTYCNAGHLPPLLFSADGSVVELESGDPALNIVPWSNFSVFRRQLCEGDLLLVYTDGLVEQENPAGAAFGKERLIECAGGARGEDLSAIADTILQAQQNFTDQARIQDDTALVLVRREAPVTGGTTHDETERPIHQGNA